MGSDFYCYGHFNSDGVCRYVGKGKSERAWSFLQRSKRWNTEFAGTEPKVVIFEEYLTEEEAFQIERKIIAKFLAEGNDLINVYSGKMIEGERDERAFEILSKERSGENHYGWGRTRPRWIIERLNEGKRLKAPKPRLGAKLSEEHKAKLHAAAHSPEARAKMAATKRGQKLSDEHRAKLSEAQKGRVRSEETRQKMSEAQKGRPSPLKGRTMPDEWRQAISKATMGRRPLTAEEQAKRLATWKARGGTTSKAKAVVCIETGATYRCAKDAAEAVGGNDKHIQACCVKRRKSHRGYTWKYADRKLRQIPPTLAL